MSYRSRFGRVHYSFISYVDSNMKWCYSAEMLEKELNEKCCGQTVTNIYVGLKGYLETMHWSENFYDFSYMGGAVLVLFEKTVLVLYIHGLGMFEYGFLDIWDVKVKETIDYVPDNLGFNGDNSFYNLNNQFYLKFIGSKIIDIEVGRTNCYPLPLSTFDEERAELAEKKNDLPERISLNFENKVKFMLVADEIEYFYVKLDLHNKNLN